MTITGLNNNLEELLFSLVKEGNTHDFWMLVRREIWILNLISFTFAGGGAYKHAWFFFKVNSPLNTGVKQDRFFSLFVHFAFLYRVWERPEEGVSFRCCM